MSFEDEDERRLQDVFKTSSSKRMFAGYKYFNQDTFKLSKLYFYQDCYVCYTHFTVFNFLPFFPLLTSCTYLVVYYFAVVMSSEEGLFVKKRKKEKKTSSKNQLSFIISIPFQLVEDMFTYITIQKLSSGNVLLKSVLKNFVKSSQEITFVRIFFSIELLAPGLQLY